MSHQRIAIVGGPRTGKTTLAMALANRMSMAALYHTDDVIDLGWSEASEEAATWLDRPGPLIAEGVAMARALRKWLSWGREGKPVDLVIVACRPKVFLSKGQAVMAIGVETVLNEIRGTLLERGVRFEVR